MARRKHHTELREYLEKTGILQCNDADMIAQAKEEYWKQYKRRWIEEKRKESKAFTILFSKQEQATINKHARHYNLSPTAMIKQASLAYLKQGHVIPDKEIVGQIRELLALNYNSLQQLQDEEKISHVRSVGLLEQMIAMEKRIMEFIQPKPHDY